MVFIRMVSVPLVTNCITSYMYLLTGVMANSQYICSSTSHSILSISHIPTLSPHSPSSYPQYPYPFISIFPISPYSSILFPHSPPSLHIPSILSPTPSFSPSTHTTAYNPYTPTLYPLPHVSSHPPTHALLTTLYALVSIFSRSLALPPITHPCIFHVKHNDNNSYFHFSILYIIYHIILYTYPLHHW